MPFPEKQYPLKIEQLQALLRRLPKQHKKIALVENELAKELTGYLGEQSLEYYYSFLNENEYGILKNIRLTNDGKIYFQLDTLILSANFLLILEIKNITGTLYFDSSLNQMIRFIDGKEEGFPDPVLQVNRQQWQLKRWLYQWNFPPVPIIGLVVISQPTTIIKTASEETKKYVIHAASLPEKLLELQAHYSKPILSKQSLNVLKRKILQQNLPYRFNPIEKFQISYDTLIKGVECPKCLQFDVIRKHGHWYCPNCQTKSKDAHIAALKDYSLLISRNITVLQACDFLRLPSRYIAIRLLQQMNLKSKGTTRDRIYELPF